MYQGKLINIFRSVNLRALMILLILALIFFAPFFINGKVFLAADNLYRYYPWKYYVSQDFRPHNTLIKDPVNSSYAEIYNKGLKAGPLNRWCPFILTGVPGLAGGAGPYYPVKMLLHTLFSTPVALTLFLFIHVMLSGFFMYYYLLEIGAGWRGALFGAIAYMFNGCVMVWLEFEMWVTVSAYLPLLLLFMERFLGDKRFRYAFAAGIAYGQMFLNSSFQLTIYVSVLMIFYLFFILWRSYGRNEGRWGIVSILTCFAITGVIAILIGAVEILPFIELASNSSRIKRTFEFHQLFDTLARVPFRYFVTLIFPDYFGSPLLLHANMIPRLPSHEYMNYNELTLYTGVTTVFAFTACMVGRKNIFSWFYLLMTLLVLAMITGTRAYYPFFMIVPGMNKMNPSRLIFLFVFAFSAAAGLGLKGLEDLTPKRRTIFMGTSLLILVGAALISFSGNNLEIARWFNKELFDLSPPDKLSALIARIHELRSISSPVIYKPLLLTMSAFCMFSLLVFVTNKKYLTLVFALLLALLSYDLISFGSAYNSTVDPKNIYPKTPAIEFLQRQPGPFRVVQDIDSGLFVNSLIPFGLEEVGGYLSVYPDRLNKLMSYVKYGDLVFGNKVFDRWVMFGSQTTDVSSNMFDLLNVRYLLTAPNVKISSKKFKLVFREDLAVYENMQVMPRAYIVHKFKKIHDLPDLLHYMTSDVFDMKSQVVLEEEPSREFISEIHFPRYPPEATIDKYTPDEITISTHLSTNGWLVLSDTYYPGWIAEVDGKEAAIQRANGALRAVALHPGKHQVSFLYKPISYRAGTIITIVGFIFAIAGMSVSPLYRGTRMA